MVQAIEIEQIIQKTCRDGCLTKRAILAAWPRVREEYPMLRSLLIRDPRLIAGPKGVGGFRATSAIAEQVAQAVREGGYVSKRNVCRRWQLRDQDYEAVRQSVLQHSDIDSAGGRGGGFRARSPVAQGADGPDGDLTLSPGIALHEWQRAAVEFLAETLSRDQLRDLVGDLAGTVRTSIRIREGTDRPSRKAELATALVLKHGRDLLRDSKIRAALSRASTTRAPQRWHPGKESALEFVEQLGLPIEFAGEPSPERKPDFEYFEPKHAPALRDFQQEVQGELLKHLSRAPGRAILTLPTGAGKTLVAVDTIRRWLVQGPNGRSGCTVLWLAHTEELCEQAYQCFSQVWSASTDVCSIYMFRFWGSYMGNLERHGDALLRILEAPCIIISTPNRIVNLIGGERSAVEIAIDALRSELRLIVVDEAHRAAAPSYSKIIDMFTAGSRPDVSLIGLTATPFREVNVVANGDPGAGAVQLQRIFENITEPTQSLEIDKGREPIDVLQERGILSHIAWQSVQTNVALKLDDINDDEANFEDIDQILGQRADKPIRRMKILQAIVPVCMNRQNSILYFGPTVHDAECMTYLLAECGVPAGVVSGDTLQSTRRKAIADFKAGRLRVLCNCQVLTMGFDAPEVTHIIVARPTVSLVLYQQMIGRGLRGPEFGGTEVCTIMDCEDSYQGSLPLGYEAFRRIWRRPRVS